MNLVELAGVPGLLMFAELASERPADGLPVRHAARDENFSRDLKS